MKDLRVGDEVYFTDPDEGLSSGIYTIKAIYSDSGTIENEDTIVFCRNEAGSELECFASELS